MKKVKLDIENYKVSSYLDTEEFNKAMAKEISACIDSILSDASFYLPYGYAPTDGCGNRAPDDPLTIRFISWDEDISYDFSLRDWILSYQVIDAAEDERRAANWRVIAKALRSLADEIDGCLDQGVKA